MKKILVIGDLIADYYLWGKSERLSPEAPVPVLEVKKESKNLGGAANVANNLISLKAKVFLCGVVGDDLEGKHFISALKTRGIDASGILIDKTRCTTLKTRIIAQNQQIARVDKEIKDPLSTDLRKKLLDFIAEKIQEIDGVILSDYNKGVLDFELTQTIITLANKHHKLILCDPKGKDYSKYSHASLITPNRAELEQALHLKLDSHANLSKALQILKETYQIAMPLVTLSEQGIAFLEKGELVNCPTIAKEVYDVTGAGDTVIASLTLSLLESKSLKDACEFANAAAAVVVGKMGSALASLEEIALILNQTHPKILPLEKLLETLERNQQKIVFTNGCFDILHKGHASYLQKAKALGDILVVGLNSDNSIKRLKGDKRPIVSEKDRAFLLASLSCVDYVVVFEEGTPIKLIQALKPDILVKGADYLNKEVIGSELAKETRLIEFEEGYSTSAIIEKIKRTHND
ncbi:D-glycero-beta-D-manno-heptose-7-phosphate kinase [Helicobacter pylori]|uniref:D-glycero-beta-D-manno-heptose-7-phosphate kinase n=1 Tax=Helicobacter pylori TaxID=210 RepID=UPI0012E6FF99|nr:D-glycero-beta-D-manno-heptose-7-phosphate kinase [Helicobacter pylori]MUV08952.1 D-glycero-beta-D-manno-heptose-7-phosphate kinase [Helicobacter pylori]WQV78420.1 D-glycero-beta-D-manno-heptose-7-phosphate kinase [Helicobacter pylori]